MSEQDNTDIASVGADPALAGEGAETETETAEAASVTAYVAKSNLGLMAVQTGSLLAFMGIVGLYITIILLTGWKFGRKKILVAVGLFGGLYPLLQYVFNLLAIKSISGDIEPVNALKTLYPVAFVIIFYGLLNVFPGWTAVFSNTIGLMIMKMGKVDELLNGPKDSKEPGILRHTKGSDSKLANQIFGSNVNFLNTLHNKDRDRGDADGYREVLAKLPKVFDMSNKDKVDKFTSMMATRHVVSESVWVLLVGLTFSISSCMSLVSSLNLT
jgi:hypothetical protein